MVEAIRQLKKERSNLIEGFQLIDLINPDYLDRKPIYEFLKWAIKKYHINKGRLLDFGCGEKPYAPLFHVEEYIGMDVEISGHSNEDKKADIYYNGENIPCNNEEFDYILTNQVFEHIEKIDVVMKELSRIIRGGGI